MVITMTIKNITITTICASITAISVSYFSIRSSCQQESKIVAAFERRYSKRCQPDDKKCRRKAKRKAEKERSLVCKYVK